MGIKHLIAIENLMKAGSWFSMTEIRDSLQINLIYLKPMMEYFHKNKKIQTKTDKKGIKRYKWK
jgi:hypothetical protein